MLDFRNTNTLYASIISETLFRLGLTTAIICPGSRSAPLTIAFAQHPNLETIPILDERSAAFFALGIAKQTKKPVVLICTSGTAVANFFPAIIEAKESNIPLLVLSADRPPELRHCHAGQTIDQVKIFGDYPNWYAELATPALVVKELEFLRNTIIHAYKTTLAPRPGVVHLNIPLREPLAPMRDVATELLQVALDPQIFFANCQSYAPPPSILSLPSPSKILHQWQQCSKGIIIAGLAQPDNPKEFAQAIALLSQTLGFPVLGEALSPLRNYAALNPYLITTYDLLLRHGDLAADLTPELVLQIGELPTSKQLRQWLGQLSVPRWIITPDHDNLDPLHGNSHHLVTTIEALAEGFVPDLGINAANTANSPSLLPTSPYCELWLTADQIARQKIDEKMLEVRELIEPKIAWLVSQSLPLQTQIFIANSMPIRDVETFWKPGDRQIQPYFSRGANGIDGTLSTALGIAHQQSSVLLTGDLALLHDTNGFLIKEKFQGHLTIILINNHGGGIFENLPIREFEPPFEEYFATPQVVNFAGFAQTYGVEYQLIKSGQQLQELLHILPRTGMRILEVVTDRHQAAQWRRDNLPNFYHKKIVP
jgi:2-succinyl-5-enolpyruvyl-6-hydroxy-3-cyclohexene-1-carboxylate synthase